MGEKRALASSTEPAPAPAPAPSKRKRPLSDRKGEKMKKRKTSSSPSSKVCLICHCEPYTGSCALDDDDCNDDNDEGDRLHVYVLDLKNSNSQPEGDIDIPAVPALRINFGEQDLSYCVMNSIIYFFDGYDYKHKEGKSAYFYELPSLQPTVAGPVLDRELLHKASPMNRVKYGPIALPTPDHRSILVFCGYVVRDSSGVFNCELYHPATDTWQVLPDLSPHLNFRKTGVVKITSYAFLDVSTIWIRTCGMGTFTLDLKSPECWQPMAGHLLGGVPRSFLDEFSVVGFRLCLSAYEVYDIHSKRTFYIPAPPFEKSVYDPCRLSMTLLRSGNEPSFCVVYPNGIGSETLFARGIVRPRLLINVHDFDLATCCSSDEWDRQFKPSSTNSYKFVLTDYLYFHPSDMSPIRSGY